MKKIECIRKGFLSAEWTRWAHTRARAAICRCCTSQAFGWRGRILFHQHRQRSCDKLSSSDASYLANPLHLNESAHQKLWTRYDTGRTLTNAYHPKLNEDEIIRICICPFFCTKKLFAVALFCQTRLFARDSFELLCLFVAFFPYQVVYIQNCM